MDVSLEYEIITQPNLTRCVVMEYQSMALPYDRALRDRQIPVNNLDPTKGWSFNMTCGSLKGILVLFEAAQSYTRDTSRFYNTKVQKVSVIVEGEPNQLYAQGMLLFEQYDEICKYFAKRKQRGNNANELQKLYDLCMVEYITDKYALWHLTWDG